MTPASEKRLEFSATLEEHTSVRKFYIFRGEKSRFGDKIGDLYLLRREIGADPPRRVTIIVEWS